MTTFTCKCGHIFKRKVLSNWWICPKCGERAKGDMNLVVFCTEGGVRKGYWYVRQTSFGGKIRQH